MAFSDTNIFFVKCLKHEDVTGAMIRIRIEGAYRDLHVVEAR